MPQQNCKYKKITLLHQLKGGISDYCCFFQEEDIVQGCLLENTIETSCNGHSHMPQHSVGGEKSLRTLDIFCCFISDRLGLEYKFLA